MPTITDEMIHAAERTLIRYAIAEDTEIKPDDVTDEAIDERLAELRTEDEANREDDPSLSSLDDVFGAMLTAALDVSGAATEWVVFYGGDTPEDCAGDRLYDDEAEAREMAQWVVGGGIAKRVRYAGPWVVVPLNAAEVSR